MFTQPFIQAQMKETPKLRVTGLCAGNSPVTGEFPAQMASNAGNFFHLMTSSWETHALPDTLGAEEPDVIVQNDKTILNPETKIGITVLW